MYIYGDIGADTYSSYWPVYAFSHDYFRAYPFEGWSFQIGLGSSVISLFPILSDPYNIFILPFSKYYLDMGIFLAATAKIFSLAILAFLYLRRLGFSGLPLIIASLSYTFSGYFIGWGQHYQFATAFILFTLVLLCFEGWLISSHWMSFVLSIGILAACSPYTTYMTLIFLSVYYIFRYVSLYNFHLNKFVAKSLSTIGLIFAGISLAGVLFFPQVYLLTQSPRVGSRLLPHLSIATLTEYYTIFMRFFSNGLLGVNSYHGYSNYYESPFLYTSILAIFLIPRLLLPDVRKRSYIWILFLCLFILGFPEITNPIFNAFSDYTYRWTFVLVPVITIALAKALSVTDVGTHKWTFLIAAFLGLLACALALRFDQPIDPGLSRFTIPVSVAIVAIFSLVYGIVLYNSPHIFLRTGSSYILTGAVVVELALTSFVTVNLRSTLTTAYKNVTPFFDSSIQAASILSKNDPSFYRINKLYDDIYLTDSLFQGFNGEKGYSSAIPGYIWDMETAFDLNGAGSNYLWGFSDVQALRDISDVKYMFTQKNNSYLGYDYLMKVDDIYVYQNDNVLPLGFVYEGFIPQTDFMKLNLAEKEYILYDAAIVPDVSENLLLGMNKVTQPRIKNLKPVPLKDDLYSLNLNITENQFPEHTVFTSDSIDPQLYIEFHQPSSQSIAVSFTVDSPVNSKGKVYFQVPGSDFNENDVEDFALKSGVQNYYVTIPVKEIEGLRLDITETPGSYSLDNFVVFSRDDDEISEQADYLASEPLMIDHFTIDNIHGTIDLDSGGLLYFSIPFDSGWKVYIDGKLTEKIKTDYAFTGVYIESGKHTVELNYSVPWMKQGLLVSTFALLFIITIAILRTRRVQNF